MSAKCAAVSVARVVAQWPELGDDETALGAMFDRFRALPPLLVEAAVRELRRAPLAPDVDALQRACRHAAIEQSRVDPMECIARCRAALDGRGKRVRTEP
jgi:hypothetical protein